MIQFQSMLVHDDVGAHNLPFTRSNTHNPEHWFIGRISLHGFVVVAPKKEIYGNCSEYAN